MICENCKKEHDGSYGSGRFCSDHCRRVYCGKRVNINGNQKCNFNIDIIKNKRSPYGTWTCRICKKIFDSKNKLYKHYHQFHENELNKQIWNKGLTAKTDDRIQKISITLKNKYSTGEILPSFKGKNHSNESKVKIKNAALNSKHQRVCKKTLPYIRKDGSIVNLDSSYERNIAKILDDNNITWIRPNPLVWVDKFGQSHHYFPDFYIPNKDIYLDPKNEYCFLVQSEKIEYIKKHYPNVLFLHKYELSEDNIIKITS